MGNIHAFAHRITALSMGCMASVALILCALAGFGCSFVTIKAKFDRSLMTPDSNVLAGQTKEMIGVMCDDSLFYDESDRMWNMSKYFLYAGVGMGGLTVLCAWLLGTCVPPTPVRWRLLSIFAAITAVMQVPIFLLFESEPCNMDVNRQTCSLALGSYFNIVSVGLWVIMTLLIQLLRPPSWNQEGEEAWRSSSKLGLNEIAIPSHEENATYEESTSPRTTDQSASPGSGGDVLLVASSNDTLAVWTMENRSKALSQREIQGNEVMSDVSSLSGGPQKDVENARSPAPEPGATVRNDDIHKGAAVVASWLGEEAQELHSSASSNLLPSFEVAAGGFGESNSSASQAMNSAHRGSDDPGLKVTIICPDGSREEAKFGTSSSKSGKGSTSKSDKGLTTKPSKRLTTSSSQGVTRDQYLEHRIEPEIVKTAPVSAKEQTQAPIRHVSHTRSLFDQAESAKAPAKLRNVPVSSLNVYRNASNKSEGVSEMTESAFTRGQSDMSSIPDTLAILEDLARPY